MFTGIIQRLGEVIKYDGNRLWIQAALKSPKLGESIAIDGVCLTLAAKRGKHLGFDIGKETKEITTLGRLESGSLVNMERALRVGDSLSGHWVSGHVEKKGRIIRVQPGRQSWTFTFQVPATIRKYVVNKGSIAIDGISLTVAAVRKTFVRVMVIPHTMKHTTLGQKKAGDAVNLEADLLAKYALR
jgi:riboflavin synthase